MSKQHRSRGAPAGGNNVGPVPAARAPLGDNAFTAAMAPDQEDQFPHQGILEALLGEDFSGVRVDEGMGGELARIGAGGLATDEHVMVPSNPSFELMAHELTHVVQQRQSGVDAAQGRPLTSQPGDASEREAVAAEAAARAGRPIQVSAAPTGAFQGDWLSGAAIGGLVGGVPGAVVGGLIGHYMDDSDEEQAQTPAPVQEPQPVQQPAPPTAADNARAIGAGYTNRQVPPGPEGIQTVALGTPQEREAAMNQLSQNQSGDPEWDQECGAHALLGSVMLGSGNQGISQLATSMANRPGIDPDERESLLDIAQGANGGTLMRGDLTVLAESMHRRMRSIDAQNNNTGFGVSGSAMQQLGAENPAIEAAMRAGRSTPVQVDTDGDGRTQHWVLRTGVGTDQQGIYDPFQRTDGQQVTHDPAAVARYQSAAGSTWQ